MITLILLAFGFLVTSGSFGQSLIGAFTLVQYWLWPVAILATLFAIFLGAVFMFGGTAMAFDAGLKNKFAFISGIGGGGLIGLIVGILITAVSYAQLWLSYFLIANIPITATSLAVMPQNVLVAFWVFIGLMAVRIMRSIFARNSSSN